MGNQGQRGGTTGSLREAQGLFRQWKNEEFGWLKARILWIAQTKGEFHGDHLENVELSERSIIGACVNGLSRGGFIRSTGEHRKSRTEAGHGRRSYVYRLTPKGEKLAQAIKQVPREALPVRPASVARADDPGRKRTRKKVATQEFGLFESDGYDGAPTVPVVPDEQDIMSRRVVRPIDVPAMLHDLKSWEPWNKEERHEALRTSPFLSDEQKARLFPDGEFSRQGHPVSWESD